MKMQASLCQQTLFRLFLTVTALLPDWSNQDCLCPQHR
jgi:hypothetical protein